jgi:outer membrane protein, multidrug efflux system
MNNPKNIHSMQHKKSGSLLMLLLILVVAGVTSCNSYKKIPAPPQVDSQGIIRDGDQNKGDTVTIANIPWKQYFTDSKLQGLIAEGLDKNINLQIALARIKQSEASLSMSRASLLPSFSAGVTDDYQITSTSSDMLTNTKNYAKVGFTAAWEIDLWGKLNNQAKAKYAGYLNSLEYRNLIQTTLVANIAKAYYNLLALDEQLKIVQENIALQQKSAETMQALKEAGSQNAAAVEQSNALLYSTQLSAFQIQNLIRQQEDVLSVLLGRKPGAVERATLNDQTIPGQLAYGVPIQMLEKRPDVKQAELSYCSAFALTKAAKASFFPSLTISSASLGFAGGTYSDLFKPEHIAAEIVAGLTQPIFNKKQIRGNYKIAQAQQEEALLTLQNTVLTAGQEVSDILYGYSASLSKNEYRDKQITSLNNAVDYTQDLLMAGEANYTEVLTAQKSLLGAQLDRVSDKLEQLNYTVSLYKALGGGTK